VLVQEQVRKGREILVGVNRDPQLGPLAAFGMGGIYIVEMDINPLVVQNQGEGASVLNARIILQG
jgi:hypothetical protein